MAAVASVWLTTECFASAEGGIRRTAAAPTPAVQATGPLQSTRPNSARPHLTRDVAAFVAKIRSISRHALELVVVAAWILGVVVESEPQPLGVSPPRVLLVLRRGRDDAAIRGGPWGIIMMVCGVSVLIAVLEKTGGMDLLRRCWRGWRLPASINGAIAFVTGAISTYSSTSGVVLPRVPADHFEPRRATGRRHPLAMRSRSTSVRPSSTSRRCRLSALSPSPQSPDAEQSRVLFRQLMAWGLSMTIVGAVLCQLFAGTARRAPYQMRR